MTTYFWSDLHIGHEQCYQFKPDGTRLRNFDSPVECEALMLRNYDRVVRAGDIVYFLGDIAFDERKLTLLKSMRAGSKRLILGNHDKFDYSPYFDKIYGIEYRLELKAILSHVPVHPSLLASRVDDRFSYNIHGHLHSSYVNDRRYLNCSVEMTGYSPVTMEELIKQANERVQLQKGL